MPDLEQQENLNRVLSRIGDCVLDFCRARRASPVFHMEELTDHVRAYLAGAPDSPSRILRELRRREFIDYVVLNRADSLYQLLAVEGVACIEPAPDLE